MLHNINNINSPGKDLPGNNLTTVCLKNPLTIWFTGLSGAGKSTLALHLKEQLTECGVITAVLDGDKIRQGLSHDLGFSCEDRTENIRRVAEVSRLFNDIGVTTICAFITPYEDLREMARRIVGIDRFLEIYLNTGLTVCESRDPKGLYKKARNGFILGFTGINDPYHPPQSPSLCLDTEQLSVAECLAMLLDLITQKSKSNFTLEGRHRSCHI